MKFSLDYIEPKTFQNLEPSTKTVIILKQQMFWKQKHSSYTLKLQQNIYTYIKVNLMTHGQLYRTVKFSLCVVW